jgi:hypothetical protein
MKLEIFLYIILLLYGYNPETDTNEATTSIYVLLGGGKKKNHPHHLANKELGPLLTCSSLTYLGVSWMVSPGFFCLFVGGFLAFSVIYYRAFRFICSNQFLMYSCIFPKLELDLTPL